MMKKQRWKRLSIVAVLLAVTIGLVAIAYPTQAQEWQSYRQFLRDRTLDHSLVQSLINAGVLTADQAREHPRRSELQSALGTRPEDLQVGASGGSVDVQAGDAFLLCSDGLWEFVSDDAMEHALGGAESPSEWLESLEHQVREAARSRASHDNFSAVAVWLVEAVVEEDLPHEGE